MTVRGVQHFDCPVCGDPSPTPKGHLSCADRDADDPQDKILGKIRKLLALAEGTTYEDEAATAWAKAQELMTAYAIDEALLRQDDSAQHEEVIVRVTPFKQGQDKRARKLELLGIIARANRVRVIDDRHTMPDHLHEEYNALRQRETSDGLDPADRKRMKRLRSKDAGVVHLVGLASDVAFVELLYMSAMMQAWRFMLVSVKEDIPDLKERRSRGAAYGSAFLAGFNGRVANRLAKENREAQRRAQEREDEIVANDRALAPRNVALALRDTHTLVDEKLKELFPGGLGRGRGPGRTRDEEGYASGVAAGDRADLSGGRAGLGANRKELGS